MSKFYCTECGHLVEEGVKKCAHCHKNPSPKDHAFKDYVLEKVEGKAEDGTLKLAVKFIKKYLYGTLMSCSLVFAGVAVVMNTVFVDNHIEMVDTRPHFRMAYTGDNLGEFEIVEKYFEAIRDGDEKMYKGLLLENVLPEVYEEISKFENQPDELGRKPLLSHTLLEYAKYYFREGNFTENGDGKNYYLTRQTRDYAHGKYGKYDFHRHEVTFFYFSQNMGAQYPLYKTTDQVEVLEVEGKYYIIGEAHHPKNYEILENMMWYDSYRSNNNLVEWESDEPNSNEVIEMILRGLLFRAGGDSSNIDFASIRFESKYSNYKSVEEVEAEFDEY